jgi:hypothetical protein
MDATLSLSTWLFNNPYKLHNHQSPALLSAIHPRVPATAPNVAQTSDYRKELSLFSGDRDNRRLN